MNTKPLSVSSPTNFLDKQSDKFLKLVSTVDGRDKLYKTIQYTARTAWWILNSKDPKNPALAKLSSLDSTFSDARRTFRLGGFIREYKDLVANTPCTPTLMGVFKYTNNLGCFIGETMDLVVWLAKHRAVNVNKDSWEWWRNVLWMLNIFYTLTDQFLLFKQTYQVYLRMVCSLPSLTLSRFLISCTSLITFSHILSNRLIITFTSRRKHKTQKARRNCHM